ncbi:hypothetical protein [Shewanella maritima]|uniref:hypothetical protein n=1 Tax=Shewanella maritima TaxID=2520507 RepID=UPI003736F030
MNILTTLVFIVAANANANTNANANANANTNANTNANANANANQCQLKAHQIKAQYQLTFAQNQDHHADTHIHPPRTNQSQLTLWRKGNTVAHQYQQTRITEAWYLLANKQIKPTRYFEQHQRGIEYQPGENVHGKTESDWSYRQQLVSNQLLQQLTLASESGQGCQHQQSFKQTTPSGTLTLVWLPQLQLISQFTWQTSQSTETWQLLDVTHDSQQVDAFFDQLNQYQMTDYADIGDDHSDPFLTSMVTLGFVEHGASGFYDDKGNALSGSLSGHQH